MTTRTRETWVFVASFALVLLVGVTTYVAAEYKEALSAFPGSADQFQIAVLALTTVALGLTLATGQFPKDEPKSWSRIDAAFLLQAGALLGNYRIFTIVAEQQGPPMRALAIATVVLFFGSSVLVLLRVDATADKRLFLVCWGQMLILTVVGVSALAVLLPVAALRYVYGPALSINDFFLNPPVGAGILAAAHVVVSFADPARHRTRAMRIYDWVVYASFTATMVCFVPSTVVNVEALPRITNARVFCAGVVAAYCLSFFFAFEWLRPESFRRTWRGHAMVIAAHCCVLGSLATAIGGAIGWYSGERWWPVIVGHGFVGIGLGIIIPAYSAAYERWLLPWLRDHLHLAAQ